MLSFASRGERVADPDGRFLGQGQGARGGEAQGPVPPVASDEVGDGGVPGVGEQLSGGGELGKASVGAHHGDLVAESERIVDVKRDDDYGLAQVAL